ncbi:MAG: hypothetical protein C4526_00730 [Nitrospiraceae bacterium]|nr:MAG: hypothetical protein C4526_00730 [Nitrospiraceae bacterium]
MKVRQTLFRNPSVWSDKSGVALIMVLWVLAVLTVIALSFSFSVRVDTHSTMAFKEEAEKEFLAEAGIERGIAELFYRSANRDQRVIIEGMETWKADGTPYEVDADTGYYTVSIIDEAGKVDINTTPDIILRNLLRNLDIEPDAIDIIVDSIKDWKDGDDLHRLHGAESDYYMSLPNPYRAKDAPFDTLEELLHVRGVTSGILYGDRKTKGLMDFITVSARTDKINLNAAPGEVLTAIPGITPEIADEIINLRQVKEINFLQEVKGIHENRAVVIDHYAGTEGAGTFSIVSAGYKRNKKSGYGIKVVVSLTGDSSYEYLYYRKGVALFQDGKPSMSPLSGNQGSGEVL